MKNAMEEAKIHPKEIDYINAHATSTPLGDLCEIKAIQKLFKEDVSSINLLGAGGAIEAIDSSINLTIDGSVSREVNYVLSNNFGFGGHNATIIMKKLV